MIEVDFSQYLPTLGIFYGYFEMLKDLNMIADVQVIQHTNHNMLKITRHLD